VRRHLLRAARGDALPSELELVIQPSRGGQPVPAVLRVARLRGRAGEVVELRCVLHDLSERRALETRTRELAGERVARDGVEQANRLKTEFLSMFSHELRTPLNAIIAYAELLEMGIPVRMPETCRSYVQAMDAAARHPAVLVEEMLGFARIEAGAYLVRRDPVPLQELAHEVASFIGPLAAREGVAVHLDLPDAPSRCAPTGSRRGRY
jgi:signal transduction histidine kinase